MANTYLGVSTTSSGTRTKWTISFWVKRSNLSNKNIIFGSYLDSSNNDVIRFNTDGTLQFWSYQSGNYSNGGHLKTNRLFRDTNAWYHIVCRWDSNNSTADDRMKIWVNGVEETSFSSRTNPTSGRESLINYQNYTTIGRLGSDYFDGCLSHVHFCDNQLYQPSDFGETDTNGVWKIKTSPSVSYGTTGYFALKDGNSLTDQSGLGNNLTVQGGTLTNTEDNPSNVFATLNPLIPSNGTTSNGNLSYTTSNSSSNWGYRVSTIGVSSGKWYSECKLVSGTNSIIGIRSYLTSITNNQIGYYSDDVGLYIDGRKMVNNVLTSYAGSYTAGDIIGIAIDLDNNKLYFSKGGLWSNGSGGWGSSTFDANVGSITITSASSSTSGFYFSGCTNWDSSGNASFSFNFGNGYFGTTAISSAGTNASGNGIFEYDVPTGYTALSTKGLNL